MPAEQSPERPREGVTPPPEALQGHTDALRRVYGIPQALPQSMDQNAMDAQLSAMREDASYNDLAELVRYNQLVNRKNALQREAQAERPAGAPVNVPEFVVVNQGETFFEYYQSILSQTLKASDDYLVLRRTVSVVPPDVLADERQTEIFLQELKAAAERRLNFSNASLVSYLLTVQRDRRGVVMQDQATLARQLEELKKTLDPAGLAAIVAGDATAVRIHGNALDQRIIELIAQKGHLPSKMLLGLQAQRYADILGQQKAVIRDGGLARERAEWEALSARNRLAREGKGQPLTEAEGLRFEQLKELLERAMPGYAALSVERREFSDGMVRTADSLSAYHERSLELLLMQHQFKSSDVTEGAAAPNPDQTPLPVREKIDEVTQMRADFHRERIGAFAGRFEEEVLTIGLPERIEDFSNKTGREFVRKVSNSLSYLFTLPAPDALGIRDYLRGRLAGPLNDAMGWPAEKMDLPFERLTPEEQKAVMDKMKSIADAVRAFDRTKITNVRNSLAVIQGLPPAKTALGEAPKDPLPELTERITSQNVDALIEQHGLPTVYVLAIRQLNQDMGDPTTGFIGEVQKFTDAVNANLDIHLDTADALFRQGDEWRRWMWALLAAAIGLVAAGYFGPKILSAGVRSVRARMTRSSAPRSTTRGSAPAAEAPPAAPAARAAEGVGAADDVVRNQQRLAELVARSGRGLQSAEALEFLRAAEQSGAVTLDRGTMALLRDSPGGQRIISDAVRTGKVEEVTRAVRAASNAAKLRVVLNAAAAAGDVFIIYMAYADWKANGERIAATDNPALKELYSRANYVYAAEGGSGVVGLSVAGYAMVSSYMAGEGILAAAAAPGALILLPIAVAAVAGGYYYRKLEGVTEDWTKEERDWLRHSQGDLLKRLEERGPGQHTYWQGAASATNAEVGWNWMTMSAREYTDWRQEGFDRVESANAGQRFGMTRAYMGQTANMPPLQGESEAAYKNRYASYLQDSMGYLAKGSGGQFGREYPFAYESAETHAELKGLSKRLSESHTSQILTIETRDADNNPKTIQFDIAQYGELIGRYSGTSGLNDAARGRMGVSPTQVIEAYRRFKITSALGQIDVMANSLFRGNQEKQNAINGVLQYELLERLRHRIAGAAMRIELADYDGLEITGAEAEAKNLSRYWVALGIRKMIRDESDVLMDKIRAGQKPTVEDFDKIIAKAHSFLGLDARQYQKDGEAGLFNSLTEARASTPDVLTYPKLRESLYLWPGALEAMHRLTIGEVRAPPSR